MGLHRKFYGNNTIFTILPIVIPWNDDAVYVHLYYQPQSKRNKEINEMLENLQVGSEVIAASGILGKVKSIKGEYISIEVSETVVFKLQRSAIANILPKGTIDSIK